MGMRSGKFHFPNFDFLFATNSSVKGNGRGSPVLPLPVNGGGGVGAYVQRLALGFSQNRSQQNKI